MAIFRFKQFSVAHDRCAMKVGTDGILLGAWTQVAEATSVVDVGTGSGLIALMLAQRAPVARIVGVETDPEAVQQARENVAASPWVERLAVVQALIQEWAPQQSPTYDLVVSNLPYFQRSQPSPQAARTAARHTVTLTHEDLLTAAVRLLRPTGRLAIILPVELARNFTQLAGAAGLYPVRQCTVQARPQSPPLRQMMEYARFAQPTLSTTLCLHEHTGTGRSAEWHRLTTDYYL